MPCWHSTKIYNCTSFSWAYQYETGTSLCHWWHHE